MPGKLKHKLLQNSVKMYWVSKYPQLTREGTQSCVPTENHRINKHCRVVVTCIFQMITVSYNSGKFGRMWEHTRNMTT